MIPVYLVAAIHPWHFYDVLVKVICTSRIQYDTVSQVDQGEGIRREIIWWLAYKTISDLVRYFILFPLNMLSFYFIHLFFYVKNHEEICKPE